MPFNPIYAVLVVTTFVAAYVLYKNFTRGHSTPGGSFVDPTDPNNWEIGPIIDGVNTSVNMPLHPVKTDDGWAIDFKGPDADSGHAHYVTMSTGPLKGKTKITLTYRFEAAPEVKFVPVKFPDAPSIICLYFERSNLKWTADYQDWRWYASFALQSPITQGEHTIEAPLDAEWTAVLTSTRSNDPTGYQSSLDNTGRVGFVLGGGDGLGHGVYASGPARLVVTSFKVE